MKRIGWRILGALFVASTLVTIGGCANGDASPPLIFESVDVGNAQCVELEYVTSVYLWAHVVNTSDQKLDRETFDSLDLTATTFTVDDGDLPTLVALESDIEPGQSGRIAIGISSLADDALLTDLEIQLGSELIFAEYLGLNLGETYCPKS